MINSFFLSPGCLLLFVHLCTSLFTDSLLILALLFARDSSYIYHMVIAEMTWTTNSGSSAAAAITASASSLQTISCPTFISSPPTL